MLRFFKQQWMLGAALVAALISMILVPPDEQYLGYFDWKTIGCLFCVLAVANAFRREGAFDSIARSTISHIKKPRALTLMTTLVTALFSMAFTNDVALIIMLPLSITMLIKLGYTKLIPVVFTLQTLAANLCGMITPFGNPQNLYLYSYFHISLIDFLGTMTLPFLVSTIGIFVIAFFATPSKAPRTDPEANDLSQGPQGPQGTQTRLSEASTLNTPRMVIFCALFIVALLAVFRILPYLLSVAIIAATLIIIDRKALARVDYGLLGTFLCFFIFAGNMARIPILETFLSPLMDDWGLLVSSLTSQVISNVPAAVVLSHFTSTWQPLLIGVNIGGAGTFVGSLASLITIRFFMLARKEFIPQSEKEELTTGKFLFIFGLINAMFFIVLLVLFQFLQVL